METNKFTYDNRRYILSGAVILIVAVFVIRLFYLQVIDVGYKTSADNNAFLRKTLIPSRGLIYDRNGKLLVYNQPAYDIMFIMREIQNLDTLDFCHTVGITKEQFDKRMADVKDYRMNPGYSSYVPQTFMNQLSAKDYGMLQEKLYKYPGFYIQSRTIREYEYPYAAHVLGDIGEVNKRDLERDKYYVQGDMSGRTGVEKSYEKDLRGEKGVEILLRDAHGRIKGKYEEGIHDVDPISGKNLTLSIDMDLQAYGEQLLHNKIGAIVMIEPSTGEVLCMVSAPSFDPGILVGRQRGKNHALLEQNPLKPLYDRAIMASHPPGSTFKPAMGLVFLQEKVITPNTMYSCHGGYPPMGGKPKCHPHPSPLSLIPALATSCNAYFCWGLRDMIDSRRRYPTVQDGFDTWYNHILSMGYGRPLGIDLPGERGGYIPTSKLYDKFYRGRWASSTIISIAIGQGEVLATPLQICNLAATVANRGHFYTPHLVKGVQDGRIDSVYTEMRHPTIDPSYYSFIAEGMRGAVTSGTCRRAALPDVDVCGKTGTAENPHGKDHSVFMGFAPYDKPKVAIAVFIENAGFGATYAVPIGKLMMEKYFYGKILEADQWLEDSIINTEILPRDVI